MLCSPHMATPGVTRVAEPMASDILAALPGAPVRVNEALGALAHAWSAEGEQAVRASQMNLVLMLGAGVGPAEAAGIFEQAQAFARRYPCRLVVLVRRAADADVLPPEAKAHVACFLDTARRDKRCCEALMLAHGPHTLQLQSLVSTWLEADLPAYLWCHRVDADALRPWIALAPRFTRVIADRSIEGEDFFSLPWPRPESVRDLSIARCLPVRQALGQFLSSHTPADLVRGLRNVTVSHGDGRAGEARGLSGWMHGCLTACAEASRLPLAATFTVNPTCVAGSCIAVEWSYDNGNHFAWEHAEQGARASVALDYATSHQSFALAVPFLPPEAALGEALFF